MRLKKNITPSVHDVSKENHLDNHFEETKLMLPPEINSNVLKDKSIDLNQYQPFEALSPFAVGSGSNTTASPSKKKRF